MSTALKTVGLNARYGSAHVLHGVDLTVEEGGIVVLLGSNGAGKTTCLKAIMGAVVRSGEITSRTRDISSMSTADIARTGVGHVVEGRGTLAELTVEDNLLAGLATRRVRRPTRLLNQWYERFEVLGTRSRQRAGLLSGGEQQMLALARAMIGRPHLLLMDEPSLGISPKITTEIYETVRQLNAEDGVSFLIVEQSADVALSVADQAYVLEHGQVTASGSAAEILADPRLRESYVGRAEATP